MKKGLVFLFCICSCADNTITSPPNSPKNVAIDRSKETEAVSYCMGTAFPDAFAKVQGILISPMCNAEPTLEYKAAYSSFSWAVLTQDARLRSVLGKIAWITGSHFADYNLQDFEKGRELLQKSDTAIETAQNNFQNARSQQHLESECGNSQALLFMFDAGSLCAIKGIGTGAEGWYKGNFVSACKINKAEDICSQKANDMWLAATSSGSIDIQVLLNP